MELVCRHHQTKPEMITIGHVFNKIYLFHIKCLINGGISLIKAATAFYQQTKQLIPLKHDKLR